MIHTTVYPDFKARSHMHFTYAPIYPRIRSSVSYIHRADTRPHICYSPLPVSTSHSHLNTLTSTPTCTPRPNNPYSYVNHIHLYAYIPTYPFTFPHLNTRTHPPTDTHSVDFGEDESGEGLSRVRSVYVGAVDGLDLLEFALEGVCLSEVGRLLWWVLSHRLLISTHPHF